jgi:cytochrome c
MTERPPLLAIVAAMAILAADAAAAATPERGEALVRRHCGGCHAAGRTGASKAPAAPPLRELHRRYEPEMLSEALGEGLLTGHPLMPEFRFEPDDAQSVILYLRSIQTRQPG